MEIEDGIPLPEPKGKIDWSQLAVGQSTFAAGASKRGLTGSTTRFGKLHGMKFAVDAAVKDGVKGVRVWRVK